VPCGVKGHHQRRGPGDLVHDLHHGLRDPVATVSGDYIPQRLASGNDTGNLLVRHNLTSGEKAAPGEPGGQALRCGDLIGP
jgi:hypothetical protein